MTARGGVRLALAALALATVSLATGIVLFLLNRKAGYISGVFSFPNVVGNLASTIAFLVMGALIVARRPGNAIGWLCLGSGLLGCVGVAALQYAGYVLVTHPGSLAGGGLAIAVPSNGAFVLPILLLIFIVLVFPTGHLISARWRPLAWLTVVSFSILFSVAVTSPLDSPFESYGNPIGVSRLAGGILVIGILGAIASVVGTFVSVVVRFRRSRGDERAQLKWLVLAAALLPAGVIAHTLAETLAPDAVGTIEAIFSIGIMAFPIAIGIAILKYRLYEIDRIISRTLVYASLTVVLAGVYVGLVLAGQAIFSSFAGGSNLAVAASTLVVAALFLPVRSRVQHFVDRRFYRRRYDAERTLDSFGTRLRQQVDLESLSVELRGAVDDTMQPAHVGLWLRDVRR